MHPINVLWIISLDRSVLIYDFVTTIVSYLILVNDYTEYKEWGVVLIRERPPCESGVRLRNAMKIFFRRQQILME